MVELWLALQIHLFSTFMPPLNILQKKNMYLFAHSSLRTLSISEKPSYQKTQVNLLFYKWFKILNVMPVSEQNDSSL